MVEQFKLVPFTLAASSEMLFRGLPILDRVKRLKELGFLRRNLGLDQARH